MADSIAEIKKLMKENKLVFGKDETLKGLRTGKFSKVFMAVNCPANLKEDATRYAGISGVEVVELKLDNTELGDVCKKPFAIAIIGQFK